MKIYIGNFWVPFPRSEYGGIWSAIAENDAQCAELLQNYHPSEFDNNIKKVVKKAKKFDLKEPAQVGIVEFFGT